MCGLQMRSGTCPCTVPAAIVACALSPSLSWLTPLLCPSASSQLPSSADSMGIHVGQRNGRKRLSCKQGVAPDSRMLAVRFLSLPARLAGAAQPWLGWMPFFMSISLFALEQGNLFKAGAGTCPCLRGLGLSHCTRHSPQCPCWAVS